MESVTKFNLSITELSYQKNITLVGVKRKKVNLEKYRLETTALDERIIKQNHQFHMNAIVLVQLFVRRIFGVEVGFGESRGLFRATPKIT